MTYVVLGMHKSGTTLVAQMLHGSGIPMVEVVSSADYQGGNKWERASTLEFDNEILAAHDLDSLSLPPPDVSRLLHDAHVARARQLVARIEAEDGTVRAGGEWGFKDPRACLTWPVWQRVLAAPRIIGVYREPEAVVRHYCRQAAPRHRKRSMWRLRVEWLALRRWCEHNECMLAAIDDAQGNSILLSYERLMQGDEELSHLRRFLRRDITDSRTPGRHAGTGAGGTRARLRARIAQFAGAGAVTTTFRKLEARRVQLLAGEPGMIDTGAAPLA